MWGRRVKRNRLEAIGRRFWGRCLTKSCVRRSPCRVKCCQPRKTEPPASQLFYVFLLAYHPSRGANQPHSTTS